MQGVRRNALGKNTLYFWLKRCGDDPDFEVVLRHAVRIIELLLESRRQRRLGRPSNVKVLWLGERLTRALNQPDDLPGLRSPRARWLLALRQLVLQRRTGEAARLLERLLLHGYLPSSSLIWRLGFHVLSRESEGRAEETRARRMVQLRASRLDAFMKQLCRLERSLIDRENLILEYVLHCLADQDTERAIHVMGFVSKDSQPSEAGLKKEVEAKRVYHLRQCYLGLAHSVIWSRRMEEARRVNAADGDHVLFEAEQVTERPSVVPCIFRSRQYCVVEFVRSKRPSLNFGIVPIYAAIFNNYCWYEEIGKDFSSGGLYLPRSLILSPPSLSSVFNAKLRRQTVCGT